MDVAIRRSAPKQRRAHILRGWRIRCRPRVCRTLCAREISASGRRGSFCAFADAPRGFVYFVRSRTPLSAGFSYRYIGRIRFRMSPDGVPIDEVFGSGRDASLMDVSLVVGGPNGFAPYTAAGVLRFVGTRGACDMVSIGSEMQPSSAIIAYVRVRMAGIRGEFRARGVAKLWILTRLPPLLPFRLESRPTGESRKPDRANRYICRRISRYARRRAYVAEDSFSPNCATDRT